MKTLDDLLLDVGAALDEMSAAHEPAARSQPPARRTRWVALAAAGVIIAAGTATVVIATRGEDAPGSIKTTEPVDPAPQPTVDVTAAPSDDTRTNPPPPPPTTQPVAGPVPGTSMALEQVGPDGAPVVPAVLPDGYRAVMADHAEGDATGFTVSEPGGWLATYIDRSGDTSVQVPSIQVQITPLDGGDVYAMTPWAPGSPDVQVGRFIGRVANGEPESVTAVIPLPDDRRLLISGTKTSLAAIETLASGLQLRDDGQGAEATVLPNGFELIDEGPVNGPTGSAEWRVAYAKEERQETMFAVTATVDPARPAVFQLAMPTGEKLEVAGRDVYRTPDGFVFDVSPALQVSVSWMRMNLGNVDQPVDLLRGVVESLVAIPPEDFEQIRAEVGAHPLRPIDLPCEMYVWLTDPASADDGATRGQWTTAAPGAVTVRAAGNQPLRDVRFVVMNGQDESGMPIEAPLLQLPTLSNAPDDHAGVGRHDRRPSGAAWFVRGGRAGSSGHERGRHVHVQRSTARARRAAADRVADVDHVRRTVTGPLPAVSTDSAF